MESDPWAQWVSGFPFQAVMQAVHPPSRPWEAELMGAKKETNRGAEARAPLGKTTLDRGLRTPLLEQ